MKLTSAQKQLYNMEVFAGGSIGVICGTVLFDKVYDIDEMKRAINEVYRINESLRTRISSENSEPVQYVTEYTEREVKVMYFDSKDEVHEYADRMAHTPFDFSGNLCELDILMSDSFCGVIYRLHHIISDGWTLALIASQFYKILHGEAVEAFPYSAYIDEEAKYLQSKRAEKDKTYFMEQYSNIDEPVYLFDVAPKVGKSARKSYIIDKTIASRIMEYIEKENTSAYIFFLTLISVYFSRAKNNAEKFCIGTTILNRTTRAQRNTAGLFVNTVPFFCEIEPENSFSLNLKNTEEKVLSLLRHQKFNYSEMLLEIAEDRLFDIIFSYQNNIIYGDHSLSTWYHNGMQNESLQIHIDDRDSDGVFRIHYDYHIEKFTETDIEKLHSQLMTLLFDGIENSNKNVSNLEIVTKEEKNTVLKTFNDTAVKYPYDKCVHELFEVQAEADPEKKAIIAADKTLTYGELNEEANRIANGLIEKGVKPGDIVAFILPRRSFVFSTMLGILKTGAAYLPIDPDYPQERISYVIEDSKAKFCISEENIEDLLSCKNSKIYNTDVRSEDVCYCIYTSGSTGKPKGTLITHKNVVNYSSDNPFNVKSGIISGECKRIVSVTTTGFDIFVTESLLPLINGMSIVFADEEQSRVQSKLANLLAVHPVQIIQTTPTKMKSFIGDKNNTGYLKDIKAIILGGEMLDSSLVKELTELTSARIYNIYGPTETTVWSTFTEITDADDITIGKPIANTQICIVDNHMNLLPIGVTGELCIAGDGVCAGYLNKPELTAEKFVDNPFGNGKLYKTGDLAYWRDDGNICYAGRNDFQVKIRGQRIELGEIENAVESVDGVVQCAVIVRKDSDKRQFICAFYTGKEIDVKEFRAQLSASLPKYMVPHIFTYLEKMPMTASGKADRNALPAVDLNNISTKTEYVFPDTPEEIIVTNAIERILKAEKVGVLDNFFDIGGDSLKSIELVSALEDKGYTLNIRTVFEAQNIRDIAAQLTVKTLTEERVSYDRVLPITSSQMNVYTAQMINENSTLYNNSYVFRTENPDTERLQTALNKMISRHEALRTHFENRNGQIVQVINDDAKLIVEQLADDNPANFIRPFDLTKAPLLRAGVFGNTVMIDLHHIVADGSAVALFFYELNELYMGRELEKTVQYGEYAVTDVYSAEDEKYWLEKYSDIPALELYTDYVKPEIQSYNGTNIYAKIDSKLNEKILDKCRLSGITAYAYYMACYNILLSKFSNNEDVCVGVPSSGRTGKFLKSFGMFANTLAMRNEPVGTKTFIDFAREVKDNSINAIVHQNYPQHELIRKTKSNKTLYDVMFAYQSEAMTEITFGDKRADVLPTPVTTSKCDLSFYVLPRENEVVLMAEYCTDLFKEETINRFIEAYNRILEQCLNENILIKNIAVLTADEKERVTNTFNHTPHTYDVPENSTLYSLFEKTSELNKGKVCIKANGEEITFDEFKNYAERIDDKIREVTKEAKSVIAVICERSFEMYGAVYGIIRGGNAYLPIDPKYPQDRIDYILENSSASAVVTQSKFAHLVKKTPCIDATELLNVSEQPEKTKVLALPDDTAYVIYTSGSTGNPKGAKISHKSAVNRILWMHDFYPLEENDVILQKTPYTFDVSVWELFWWGIIGGALAVSKPDEHFLPAKILLETEKNKVTHLHFVPSVFDLFLTYLENYPQEQSRFDTVKYVFLSGEALMASHISRFYKIFDYNRVQLHNLYGPTECAVDVSYYPCVPEDTDPVPIGKPIYNTQLYIVDKYMNPLSVGVAGELCIAGVNVGQGYLNNPELTAEKFIDNPFGYGKLYKTGDLAYWRNDGNICYVGRMDGQIKLNGQRVELGEIEKIICKFDGIESAAAMIRKNNSNDVIVAFCCGENIDINALKKHCEKWLPSYMVPSGFTMLAEMPLNPSGKLDRKALKNIDVSFDSETEKELPENEEEKVFCDLFAKVLKKDVVGRNENFFALGGSSLDMITILSEKELNGVSAVEFIANATPQALAKLELHKKNNEYLQPLYEATDGKKALVLFPFAGGGAEAFAGLVESLRKKTDAVSIYFVRYLHSADECEKAAMEIAEYLQNKQIYFYSHCVGSAVALQILSILDDKGKNSVVGLIAGASIPLKKPNKKNTWNIVPDYIMKKILIKAGASLDKIGKDESREILYRFRKDVDFSTEYFFRNPKKVVTPVYPVISKKDIFTKDYRNAKHLWSRYSDQVNNEIFIDSVSHYFQSDNSEELASIVLDILK